MRGGTSLPCGWLNQEPRMRRKDGSGVGMRQSNFPLRSRLRRFAVGRGLFPSPPPRRTNRTEFPGSSGFKHPAPTLEPARLVACAAPERVRARCRWLFRQSSFVFFILRCLQAAFAARAAPATGAIPPLPGQITRLKRMCDAVPVVVRGPDPGRHLSCSVREHGFNGGRKGDS